MWTSVDQVVEFYHYAMNEKSDPRVSDYPLMSSPWPMLVLTSLYLYIVWQGPKWMATRPAFDLKPLLIVYNLSLVVLSVYMFWEFFATSVLNPNFSLICQPVDYGTNPMAMRLANVVWWYYFSKIIEFMDTFFFILRKKNNQISFLHVYHHSTMVVLWYIGTRWVAGGESYFSAMINSFIHILMYTYYGLSAFGPKMQKFLWWKKYMTSLQLLQFGVVVLHTAVSIHAHCGFPEGWEYFLIGYMFSHIILFGNFYHQAYVVKNLHQQKRSHAANYNWQTKSGKSNGAIGNGIPNPENMILQNGNNIEGMIWENGNAGVNGISDGFSYQEKGLLGENGDVVDNGVYYGKEGISVKNGAKKHNGVKKHLRSRNR